LEGEDADRLIRLRRMERELEQQYQEFLMRKDPKKALQRHQEQRRRLLAKSGVAPGDDADDADDVDDDAADAGSANPLLRDGKDLSQEDRDAKRKAALWFSQPLFAKALGQLNDPLNQRAEDQEAEAEEDDDDDEAIRAMAAKVPMLAARHRRGVPPREWLLMLPGPRWAEGHHRPPRTARPRTRPTPAPTPTSRSVARRQQILLCAASH